MSSPVLISRVAYIPLPYFPLSFMHIGTPKYLLSDAQASD